jgi:nitrilase
VRLALWQTAGVPADKAANLVLLERTATAAAAAGAALLLCPECWLCGYNIGAAVTGLAEARDGPSARRIGEIARRHGIAIAYGYAELDSRQGCLYNAVQVLGPGGGTLAHYRKVHLFGPEERAAYRPGDCFEPPFTLQGVQLGLLICYDVEFPESVRSLALRGAHGVLIPTALTPEYAAVPRVIIPARALENQVFVAYCNHTGAENGMPFLGGSCVAGTDGEILAAAGATEALLVADIDTARCAAGAQIFPYLRDRRPELYRGLTADAPGIIASHSGDVLK